MSNTHPIDWNDLVAREPRLKQLAADIACARMPTDVRGYSQLWQTYEYLVVRWIRRNCKLRPQEVQVALWDHVSRLFTNRVMEVTQS